MVLCTTPSGAPLDRKRPCWVPSSRPNERTNNENVDCFPMNDNNSQVSTSIGKQQRNVTVAYNYQVSLVDEFVGAAPPRRSTVGALPESTSSNVKAPPKDPNTTHNSDTTDPNTIINNIINKNNNAHNSTNSQDGSSCTADEKEGFIFGGKIPTQALPPSLTQSSSFASVDNNNSTAATPGNTSTRRSNRDTIGKRKSNLARNRVRYDMEMIPPIERNAAFLNFFERKWWIVPTTTTKEDSSAKQPSRRSTRIKHTPGESTKPEECPFPPFLEASSVVWVPSKRSDWEDCVGEMTAICASAEWRRREKMAAAGLSAPLSAPLSREYIKDRVDIDDPLNGFQIRHSTGGWMQGFLMWTNFTTWTRNFKWDSLHPQSGIPAAGERELVDRNGDLSSALEALPRTGDPLTSGIIFEYIAEIGLVGSLGGGCGEYLLHMALDDIRAQGKYKFVVLQATESSRGFYERYGFIRVGAICRYESNLGKANPKAAPKNTSNDVTSAEEEKKNEEVPPETPPIVGYRHWTHANESDASLQMHGGPSYMMCLQLPLQHPQHIEESPSEEEQDTVTPSIESPTKSLLKSILIQASVRNKPTIEAVSNMTTVTILQRLASARAAEAASAQKPTRSQEVTPEEELHTFHASTLKRTASAVSANSTEPPTKRRKNSDPVPVVTATRRGPGRPRLSEESMPAVDAPPKSKRKSSASSKKTPESAVINESTTKPAKKKKTETEVKEDDRTYYSVRGPDGRFMRIRIGEEPPPNTMTTTTVKKKSAGSRKSSHTSSGSPVRTQSKWESPQATETAKPEPTRKTQSRKQASSSKKKFKTINAAELRKQKVKAYPRDRPHFYNRVVKPIDGSVKYYFVFEYNEDSGEVRLVPMEARGTLMGKRQGRPRYQCCIGATDENFFTDSSENYQVVDAHMVMKTPLVAQEAWDIEDD